MGIPKMDWIQVALNGAEPCFAFHPETDSWFCGRAKEWAGHGDFIDAVGTPTGHRFVPLEAFITRLYEFYFANPVKAAFLKGRESVVFEPHSAYRDKLREMICEGEFDFTKIFEEIEYEGETYTDISNEGADALADYFIGLMEQIDERRSENAEDNYQPAMDSGLDETPVDAYYPPEPAESSEKNLSPKLHLSDSDTALLEEFRNAVQKPAAPVAEPIPGLAAALRERQRIDPTAPGEIVIPDIKAFRAETEGRFAPPSRREEAWKRDSESLLVLVHTGDFELRRRIKDAYNAGFVAGNAIERYVLARARQIIEAVEAGGDSVKYQGFVVRLISAIEQAMNREMSQDELALAKAIGEQMSGKILCPRRCVEGQELSTFGDFEDQLFCPHCEMEVQITVVYD